MDHTLPPELLLQRMRETPVRQVTPAILSIIDRVRLETAQLTPEEVNSVLQAQQEVIGLQQKDTESFQKWTHTIVKKTER